MGNLSTLATTPLMITEDVTTGSPPIRVIMLPLFIHEEEKHIRGFFLSCYVGPGSFLYRKSEKSHFPYDWRAKLASKGGGLVTGHGGGGGVNIRFYKF